MRKWIFLYCNLKRKGSCWEASDCANKTRRENAVPLQWEKNILSKWKRQRALSQDLLYSIIGLQHSTETGEIHPLSCCRTRMEVSNYVPSRGFLPEPNELTMLFRLHKIVYLFPWGKRRVHPGKIEAFYPFGSLTKSRSFLWRVKKNTPSLSARF